MKPSLAAAAPLCLLFSAHAQAPQYAMDYGPFMSGTIAGAEPRHNVALKGLAIHVGPAAVCFDTELLRISSAWQGEFLNLRGTAYDGGHGTYPSVAGDEVFMTRNGPGWARNGSFDDPRPIPHGPLPRSWGRYRGLYLHGRRVVLSYDVAGCGILETHDVEAREGLQAISRSLEIDAGPALEVLACQERVWNSRVEGNEILMFRRPPVPRFVSVERTRKSWRALSFGGPSDRDYADAASGHGVTLRWVDGFSAPHPNAGAKGHDLPRLLDGQPARNADDTQRCSWFDAGAARLVMDLRTSVDVQRVHAYSWHRSDRAPVAFTVYGSNAALQPNVTGSPSKSGWMLIASGDTRKLGRGGKHGVAIAHTDGHILGRFRRLLFVFAKPSSDGSFLTEIDVWAKGQNGMPRPAARAATVAGVAAIGCDGARWQFRDGSSAVLKIPASATKRRVKLVHWRGGEAELARFDRLVTAASAPKSFAGWLGGGAERWAEKLTTKGRLGKGKGPYVVDTITVPATNPWKSRLRFGAFDFFAGGKRAALSTWNGDVWIVSGLDGDLDRLVWKRFATGLFDTLGLKIVDGVIYTHGRDQITRLQDLDRDGEADFYECFNNDVYVTTGFHEFAFDLQTDPDGNFFFAKGGPVNPGGRGFQKITPHAGTILKLSKDGRKLSVYATGLRAPNGIGVGPTGQVTSGDNEGTWMPRCRLNWIEEGSFLGCVPTAHRAAAPTDYDKPLCWLPFEVDNSSGGQVWVTSKRWGPFEGELVHLSYGQCRIFKVLKETVNGQIQGGIVRFPVSFESSCMRARFNPADGQLYVCGFKGWQTRAAKLTAFQRVRYTGKPVHMPAELHVAKGGIYLKFTCDLDPETANDAESFGVEQWNYLWTSRYGSPEVSAAAPSKVDNNKGDHNHAPKQHTSRDAVEVKSARLLDDKRTVFLSIPSLRPVMQMKISFNVDAADGTTIRDAVYNTIHEIPK